MNLHENTDFGRKVFFLNPPFNFRNIILPILADMEYEIYVIEDYKKAKSILRSYPDSICFVYINTAMSIDNWFNFIMSFDQDQLLSTIFLGVLADRATKADRNHFLLNAVIPAGFISLTVTKNEQVEILHGILEINGAKGQRKYVRADCKADKQVTAHCEISGVTYYLRINNISSVGLSCSSDLASVGIFTLNLLIHDLILRLHEKKVKCNAVVTHLMNSDKETTFVILFTKGMPFMAKNIIKEYVRFFLQNRLNTLVSKAEMDNTDYTKKLIIKAAFNDAFLIAVDEEELLEENIQYADDPIIM